MSKKSWRLAPEVRIQWIGAIKGFIKQVQEDKTGKQLCMEFTNTNLSPYTLGLILEELGYKQYDLSHNGWEMDFDIVYVKEGETNLIIRGTGITFDMSLVTP